MCCLLVTESPDIVNCLTKVVNLCFPEYDLTASATSPLALVNIIQRMQHFVAGGSMSEIVLL